MNTNRDNTIAKLSNLFSKEEAIEIENGIYKFSTEYATTNNVSFLIDSIYLTKVTEILEQIETKQYLYNVIKSKKIELGKIAYMKPEELNPDKYESVIKKIELAEYSANENKGSSLFTCKKCKKANCHISTRQMRSGDEAPTTFVTCLECNHVFSFN